MIDQKKAVLNQNDIIHLSDTLFLYSFAYTNTISYLRYNQNEYPQFYEHLRLFIRSSNTQPHMKTK